MNVNIDWEAMLKAAVTVVGLIRWVTKFPGKSKSLLAWILLPVASFAYALAQGGGLWTILPNGAFYWGQGQLGYPVVVKLPEMALEWLKRKVAAQGPAGIGQ